jgi:hypothetical protein
MLVINQLDVTLFTLHMFRTILVHHQQFCFVRHAGLTEVVCWSGIRYSVLRLFTALSDGVVSVIRS